MRRWMCDLATFRASNDQISHAQTLQYIELPDMPTFDYMDM